MIARVPAVRRLLIATALLANQTALSAEIPSRPSSRQLAILPGEIVLHGPKARQRIVVEEADRGAFVGQLAGGVLLTSSDEQVVRVKDGIAIPVGDGVAKIAARSGERIAKAAVTVIGMSQPTDWSFRNHVQSVLSKMGCNSGACHGALAGKKGFKLSLRGYDADGDWLVLTHQARGRRVDLADPTQSLMLLKPTAAIAHGGGLRFGVDSEAYKIISEWIADGAVGPKQTDARVVGVEMFPKASIQRVGASQQLLVRATFSDGRSEDVTQWSKFDSSNAEVAQIDQSGRATIMGRGEGSVTAWYLNRIALASISVPYEKPLPTDTFAKSTRNNFIDDLVVDKLKALNIPPSPMCSDGEFVRRIHIDALGILPTADETLAFVADKSPEKRTRLIEQVLRRPEFVDYWSYKWSDLLLVNSEKLDKAAMWSYYSWIRANVSANTPWDEFARKLVTAQGSTLENGATNFFVLHQDPLELNETISQAFLGMSINCARCHNHPLEKWTNDQYFGMANLIARVRLKDGNGNLTVYAAPEGDLVQPLSGLVRTPTPLDGKPIPMDSTEDRRIHLAKWLTDPSNPYFTRAIVNRVWANFMGVGLVEKVDDLRLTNPSSNDKLFAGLCDLLHDNRYDLKQLMKAILESAAYQRSSVPLPENADDKRFYSRYYPRRLIAEAMIDGISQITEVPTKFSMIPREFAGDPKQFPDFPYGWRAMQLPDTKFASYFLQRFGRPDRDITCECERSSEPNVVQVLHLTNGDVINAKLQAKDNRIDKLLASGKSPAEIVDRVYLMCVSRAPSESERKNIAEELAAAPSAQRRVVLEDLFWALMSSREFLFNH